MLKFTALALCLVAAPLFAAPPPPATEVRANVHAAATLALGLLDRTPTAGDAAQESAIFQTVAAGGLGEVMGWGQNYWDNVDPAVTKKVLAAFQAAFRLLDGLGDSTLSLPALQAARTKLAPHFTTMRTAVAGTDLPQRKLEAATLAKLTRFHLAEMPGSPMTTPSAGLVLAPRTIEAGAAGLEAGLSGHPDLLARIAPALSKLRALKPASGSPEAALKKFVESALPHLDQVGQALN